MPSWREDPATVRPMLASLDEPPIVQHGLVYEPKYDGIRAIVDVQPASPRAGTTSGRAKTTKTKTKTDDAVVRIYSRNGREKHAQFPAIVQALTNLASTLDGPVIFDGEIVALDTHDVPMSFQHIQGRIHLTDAGDIARAESAQPAALVLFDLLRDGREDLRGQPLAARRLRLQEIVRPRKADRRWIRLSEIATDDGRALLQRAKREGWEGLIVKDGQSVYESARRTPAWRKLKLLKQQEFVIGGWTAPRQSRQHFGALLVGYHDDNGALRWAGSVGTGFNQAELDRVAQLLTKHAVKTSPFADRFKTAEPAFWVKPTLVAEVRFTEWTSDGLLRQPVYLGMRTDKPAKDVRREDAPAHGATTRPALPANARYHRNTRDTGTGPVVEQLLAIEKSRRDGDLALPNGESLHVTNLSKVFWPALGITKGELLRYYAEVAPMLLPAVADRPLVMRRFPNGLGKVAFYQQKHPEAPPPGVRREVLPEHVDSVDDDGPRERLIGGSLTTLLYMVQLAAISQDPWFSRVSDPLHQDYAAIDLDPGDGASFERVLDVARWTKDVLDTYGIPAWPKTSGASGLHIYIPLPPGTTYDSGQLLCQTVATVVATAHPKVATVRRMVKTRPHGTVYVDYLQNIVGKTIATAYSARASDYAGVSTPLTWQEVQRGVDPRDFTIRTATARFRDVGDLWKGLRTSRPVDLNDVIRRHGR